jgi:hypothetical protein
MYPEKDNFTLFSEACYRAERSLMEVSDDVSSMNGVDFGGVPVNVVKWYPNGILVTLKEDTQIEDKESLLIYAKNFLMEEAAAKGLPTEELSIT